jgi:hypothetical protein
MLGLGKTFTVAIDFASCSCCKVLPKVGVRNPLTHVSNSHLAYTLCHLYTRDSVKDCR